ncbi:MAG: hypothetical protein B6I18_06155 [Bacteroidetes bacterium 4572_112]|nr:MAG: hypothetical protein B6I18_06155 [Bacteroidetes bacterium 4572_112]
MSFVWYFKFKNMITKLVNSPFFVGFNKEQILEIFESIHYSTSQYKKNDIICRAGDDVRSLMIISKGNVRTEMLDATGSIFRMDDIYVTQIIGPGFLYGDNNVFPVNVVSNCDVSIISIQKKTFEYILAKHPKLMINYLNVISNKTQFLSQKIKNVFLQSIEGKIAIYLLKIAKQTNSMEFEMEHSQTWLAERFNVARPSIARVFSHLKSKGIIDSDKKIIKILDKRELMRCVN